MTSPIENPDLLTEMIRAALAAKATSIDFDVEQTVKSAVQSVINADRAYRDYIKELSGKAQQAEAQINQSPRLKDILASVGAPAFGEYWESQGGRLVAYDAGHGNIPESLLIGGTNIGQNLGWGPYGSEIEGADSKTDGMANTQAIIQSGLDCPAAKFAVEYVDNGHSDFFLPAIRDLKLIDVFGASELDGDFWSSTQYSALLAWLQGFGGGDVGVWGKTSEASVLPLRRLVL